MSHYETTWRQLIGNGPAPSWAPAARAALWLAAAGYGAGVRAYRACYDLGLVRTERLPCPVIGVGNLTVGGTGKTTTVAWIVRELMLLGASPAILSRGYGSAARQPVTVVADRSAIRCGVEQSGDEPQMLARALPGVPILVGRNRRVTGRAACREMGADACVLDDSFQYWRLRKDLELLLIDAAQPLAHAHLFPRGRLREPVSAARRAHAAILTHADRASRAEKGAQIALLLRHNPSLRIAEARHHPGSARPLTGGEAVPPAALSDRRWLAISSLGDPASFPATLAAAGINAEHVPFPDHHPYTAAEVEALARRAAGDDAGILTTEKDAVKLNPAWVGEVACWVLSVELEFLAGEEAIRDLLRQCLAKTS